MTKQIDELMDMVVHCVARARDGHDTQAEQLEVKTALEAALKPGEFGETDVWHEGSRSFYRAVLLHKLTPKDVGSAPPAQTPLPTHETPAMHAAVMKVMYEGGVTRTTTDKLWQAYRCAITSDTPPAQTPVVDTRAEFVRVIEFAINQGLEASEFLDAWLHGDTSEWPEFAVAPMTAPPAQTPSPLEAQRDELMEALRSAIPALVQCERAYRSIGAAVGQGEFERALAKAIALTKHQPTAAPAATTP